ncbi:hypothetical protein E4T38_08989 [Aureobasidium subglaciale]|nr:hypothetical protein E4T38_08989 [Aureobasidium subglaciale]KAI5214540.1 hypothetical protein E4T40_08949 [Aureobasidium subglaciale]KAI5217254.1 hypothetical protein E4T41_08908 [Aureobasidium subglaciale]KAI5254992.1 hypothetical protein E4T46_08942 [Aureobasidium subglaciale]
MIVDRNNLIEPGGTDDKELLHSDGHAAVTLRPEVELRVGKDHGTVGSSTADLVASDKDFGSLLIRTHIKDLSLKL